LQYLDVIGSVVWVEFEVSPAPLLGACPRIGIVARGSYFESIFSSFEANSCSYLTKMSGKMGQKGFSAAGLLFSDRLLGKGD